MSDAEEWVLLAYRLPRVPSTPRSAVWRKLKRLGVAQLSDGLVALPADARTREHLEWIAEEVTDNGGDAVIWLGRLAEASAEASIIARMSAAIAAEYDAAAAEATRLATADTATRQRAVARLRRELHRIEGRDYFPAASRETARLAIEALAVTSESEARS